MGSVVEDIVESTSKLKNYQIIKIEMESGDLPFTGLRVVELDANLISGRLSGMLFADQGAEVIILKSKKESHSAKKLTDGDETCERRANDMLNRNKVQLK